MTPKYQYINIDPANPPEMPCEAVFKDFDDSPRWVKDRKLISIVQYNGKTRFIDSNFQIWKHCKPRKEKTIDFRNRWVKIKTWGQMEKEYGLKCADIINTPVRFPRPMENRLPENRVIKVNEHSRWDGWNICKEMISEILPIDYQPERELDNTTLRQWFYSDRTGSKYIKSWFLTEKDFVEKFAIANNVVSYAPGLQCPEESAWRKV